MSSDVSRLNAFADAAITALLAGDYATAIVQATAAKMMLARMPDLKEDGREMTWKDPADADSFIADCRQLASTAAVASVGIRQTKITYARPSN